MAASNDTRVLPTPYFAHLNSDDWEHVYEPSEDTFLMMDALEAEQEVIRDRRSVARRVRRWTCYDSGPPVARAHCDSCRKCVEFY